MTTSTLTRVNTGFLYQRVSSSEQDTARQHAENRQAAAELGLIPREYCDDGIGASSRSHGKLAGANRPDWRAMMADIMTAIPGDTLIVHDVSRADRQAEFFLRLLAECRRHAVLVHVTGEHETYDPGKANHWRTLATAGVAAESESLVKGDQIRSGKAYWRSQGHPAGRFTYGIHRVKDDTKSRNSWVRDEPDPATAPTVKRIVLAVGKAEQYHAIARALDADGIPTPRGGKNWNASTVVKIAGNADYVRAGIVTQEEHAAAAAVIARTRGTGRGSGAKAQQHRYSGVLHCHRCGKPCRGSKRDGYRCPDGHTSIPAADVDAYLDAFAIARLSRDDALPLFSSAGDPGAVLAARQEAAALQANLDAFLDDDGITPAEYKRKKAGLQPRIDTALRRAQEASIPSALSGLADADRAVVAARWHSLTVQARRAAMIAMCPRALLGPGTRDGMTPVEQRVTLLPDGDL
jgi:DNA invertase Pin-like site-specific DNA recombinase